jgi:hypothetical protein
MGSALFLLHSFAVVGVALLLGHLYREELARAGLVRPAVTGV